MHSLCLRLLGDFNDFISLKVRLLRLRWTQQICFIHDLHMLCVFIGLGINTHSLNPKSLSGSGYTTRDLTPVSDQYLFKHLVNSINYKL